MMKTIQSILTILSLAALCTAGHAPTCTHYTSDALVARGSSCFHQITVAAGHPCRFLYTQWHDRIRFGHRHPLSFRRTHTGAATDLKTRKP